VSGKSEDVEKVKNQLIGTNPVLEGKIFTGFRCLNLIFRLKISPPLPLSFKSTSVWKCQDFEERQQQSIWKVHAD